MNKGTTKASIVETSQQPTLSLSAACLRTHVPGARYLAVALDLDAPVPSLPLASPILHYLHTDLTAVTSPFGQPSSGGLFKTDTATNTWVKLEPSSAASGSKGSVEQPLASWTAPAPPGVSAPHRYVFLIWEQPKRLNGEMVRASLGMGKTEGGKWSRVRWDVEGFVSKLKLGEIVAGTWMYVGN